MIETALLVPISGQELRGLITHLLNRRDVDVNFHWHWSRCGAITNPKHTVPTIENAAPNCHSENATVVLESVREHCV
jgi:hypothetical protein